MFQLYQPAEELQKRRTQSSKKMQMNFGCATLFAGNCEEEEDIEIDEEVVEKGIAQV